VPRLDVAKTLGKSGGTGDAPTGDDTPPPAESTAAPVAPPKKPVARKPTGGAGSGEKPVRTTKPPKDQTPVSDDPDTPLPHEYDPQEPRKNTGRVAVPMPKDMRNDLALARIEDGVEATVRIRAMVELWQKDRRLRQRVDKLAKVRSAELISHRWPSHL
jgi:hypothetical protein